MPLYYTVYIDIQICTLYVFCQQVRCLTDHGEFETQDGNIILLKKNTQVCSLTDLQHNTAVLYTRQRV